MTAELLVEFFDETNALHSLTIAQATEELRLFYNAWPGGLEEVDSCVGSAFTRHRNTVSKLVDACSAISEAIAQFRTYEQLHLAKGTTESIQKAAVNQKIAKRLEDIFFSSMAHAKEFIDATQGTNAGGEDIGK